MFYIWIKWICFFINAAYGSTLLVWLACSTLQVQTHTYRISSPRHNDQPWEDLPINDRWHPFLPSWVLCSRLVSDCDLKIKESWNLYTTWRTLGNAETNSNTQSSTPLTLVKMKKKKYRAAGRSRELWWQSSLEKSISVILYPVSLRKLQTNLIILIRENYVNAAAGRNYHCKWIRNVCVIMYESLTLIGPAS